MITFLLVYITESDDAIDTPYFSQLFAIMWCCMVTVCSLIVPRLYYLARPPGAEFYTKKASGGATGTSIPATTTTGSIAASSSGGGGGGAGNSSGNLRASVAKRPMPMAVRPGLSRSSSAMPSIANTPATQRATVLSAAIAPTDIELTEWPGTGAGKGGRKASTQLLSGGRIASDSDVISAPPPAQLPATANRWSRASQHAPLPTALNRASSLPLTRGPSVSGTGPLPLEADLTENPVLVRMSMDQLWSGPAAPRSPSMVQVAQPNGNSAWQPPLPSPPSAAFEVSVNEADEEDEEVRQMAAQVIPSSRLAAQSMQTPLPVSFTPPPDQPESDDE